MVITDLIRQRRGKSFECSFQTTQRFKIETLHLISLFLSITDPLARMDKEVFATVGGLALGFCKAPREFNYNRDNINKD